ncbi:hypothetical protein ACWCPX_21285 [Streptomyces olivaceoviridis]
MGTTYTAFTGALLRALPGPVALSLDDLFDEVRRDLALRDMPRPQRRVVNNAGKLILARPPDPDAPRLAFASDPPPTAWTDPGASASPKPRRPKVKIHIPIRVWPLFIAAAAGLGGWYWLHTQTHWSKGDLRDAVHQVAADLNKESRVHSLGGTRITSGHRRRKRW